uniref:Retrovirus-related Pol polyprotein from transposon TNT 1-94 n=1 Tax=Tanacetum cinerariifolium TaxID=118510 RepID=A0A699GK16_TANCI|nr:retrovirus-related Pol polyprotein from transposon TNT 1-94 [Tanacetum cinerariifolium]
MVDTVMSKNVNTARPNAVVNAFKGNILNAVKASACWVWKLKTNVIDHVSKYNGASITLKKFNYVDAHGRSNGCSRHMTGNMSYLTDYEEIDGGYVAFGGNLKEWKITSKESVNTACYVQNRVLVVKPYNKTPYALFHGRTPALSFMKPFGCLVTILNTLDHLGKFNGKDDEGFFVGYLMNSKAFIVFNSRKRIVEENLHIRFSENTPYVVGSGPDWLFDIDALKRTMNCELIATGTQSNAFVDPKISQDNAFQPLSDSGKKVNEDPSKGSEWRDQEQDDNVNNTNNVNAASTNEVYAVRENIEFKNASSPMETQKPLLRDEDGEEVEVYIVCMCKISWQRKKLTMVGNSTTEAEYVASSSCCGQYSRFKLNYLMIVNPIVYTLCIEQFWATVKAKTITREVQLQALVDGKKVIIIESTVRRDLQLEDAEGVDCLPNASIFKQLTLMGFLMYLRFVQVFLDKQLEGMSTHNRIYVTTSQTKKIFRYMRRVGKGFSRRETPLFPTMMVQAQEEMGEANEAVNKEMDDRLVRAATTNSSLEAEHENVNINNTQPKATANESSSQGTDLGGGPRCQQAMRDTIAQTRVKSFDDNEDLGEDESKQGRISNINEDEGITLVSTDYDAEMFDVDKDLHGEEVFIAQQDENVVEKEVVDAQV